VLFGFSPSVYTVCTDVIVYFLRDTYMTIYDLYEMFDNKRRYLVSLK